MPLFDSPPVMATLPAGRLGRGGPQPENRMTRLIGLLSLVAGLALLMHGGIAPAQAFPAKPVRIIVTFGPGVVDTGARSVLV